MQTTRKLIFVISLFCSMSGFAETIADPCAPTAMLNIVDRPTNIDSACAVSLGHFFLEAGYQYERLIYPTANAHQFPELTLRMGLPYHNEIIVLLPDETIQTTHPRFGFSATALGIKHELAYTEKWLAAVEVIFTLPSGSASFGSHSLGVSLNGIVSYSFTSTLNLAFLLGLQTATVAINNGGGRFNSVNPDVTLTYSLTPNLEIFGEVYGQTKTDPFSGSGFNTDAGISYLLMSNMTMDIEAGQRISGNLQGYNHYIGTGFAVEL